MRGTCIRTRKFLLFNVTYKLRRIDRFVLSAILWSKLIFDLLSVKTAILFTGLIALTWVFQNMTLNSDCQRRYFHT
jgi:hypothetical protein